MSGSTNYKFYLRIVLPSILAIALFVISISVIIIPGFERNMLDRKKEMISELTHAAWSVLDEYQQQYEKGNMTLNEAQKQAAGIIKLMRYGAEQKDYFWIIDMHAYMVMHPYRPELNGTDLSKYEDPEGTFLFTEAVEQVKKKGEGFIQYIWQWKDDSTRLVPKLSYVKGYPEWGWVIGTGIYLEDVKAEIALLKGRLLRISLLIIVVIAAMLFYMVRQSLMIERRRKRIEEDLKLSRQKYKSLVEASTEGTIMVMRERIIFANLKLAEMIGDQSLDVQSMKFEDIFELQWGKVLELFTDPHKTVSVETKMKCKDDSRREVVISVSNVDYARDNGYIVVAKDVTRQKSLEKGSVELSRELQMALSLMNQPVKTFIKEVLTCTPEVTVADAADLMSRKNRDVVFICLDNRKIGSLNERELKSRVLARKLPYSTLVSEVMSSPVVTILEDALLYEALLLFKNAEVTHLLVKDINGEDMGMIAYQDVLTMQHNSVSFIIREVENAESVDVLEKIYSRTPALVNALLEIGDKTGNINHVITSLSDALSIRVVELAIERLGKAPCDFAFVALGSEGRMEQTLSTDQDNAIVFHDMEGESREQAYRYFSLLAKDINTKLNQIGFRFCKGEIMAMNPQWTQPLSVWKNYFSDWINSSDPQSILDSSIFFDLRCIYGDCNFVDQLIDHIHQQSENKAVFFQHMANPIIRSKSRVGMFGGIVGDQEEGDSKMIDVKKIQLPIVGFSRIYAIKHKLHETNTLSRLEKLHSLGVVGKEVYEELSLSYGVLMQLRLRFQSKAIINNVLPDNLVDVSQLNSIERATLKKILSELGNIQTQLSFDFKGSV